MTNDTIDIVFLSSNLLEPPFVSPVNETSTVAGKMAVSAGGDIVYHVGDESLAYETAWLEKEELLLAFDTEQELDPGKAIERALIFHENPDTLHYLVQRDLLVYEMKTLRGEPVRCCFFCKDSTSQLYPRGDTRYPVFCCESCGNLYELHITPTCG